jgi:hypothetical protein
VDGSIDAPAAALANRYAIEALLGRGATASVYLAHDLRHGRRIALKVLHDALGAAVGVERFQREIWVAARLQHPNIFSLFDSGLDGGRLWYATPRQRRRASGPGRFGAPHHRRCGPLGAPRRPARLATGRGILIPGPACGRRADGPARD